MTSTQDPELRDRIRSLRLQYALSQLELATYLGVSRATVNRWEAGYPASPLALRRIAQLERRWARMEHELEQQAS